MPNGMTEDDQPTAKRRKKNSPLRITDAVAVVILCLIVFSFFLKIVITGKDPHNRLVSNLGTMFLLIVPFPLERIFKKRMSDFVLTFYLLYIFFAGFLGNVFLFYKFVPFYDKVIHTIFGYVGCVAGLYLLCKLCEYDKMRGFYIAVACFAFSMACGAVWEIIEYLSDLFLHQTSQGIPILTADGKFVISIKDTMEDLVANFLGAFLFTVHYAIHRASKKNLFLGSVLKDFNKKS